MPSVTRLKTTLKSLTQLGIVPVGRNLAYRLGLLTGIWRRQTPPPPVGAPRPDCTLEQPLTLPEGLEIARIAGPFAAEILKEAGEICQGKVRLFGGLPQPLLLVPPAPLVHWTEYERGRAPWGPEDVKFIWEPARFGWALTLAQAYRLSGTEQYAQAFWEYAGQFIQGNPPFLGPHWASAQEAAIRLICLALAAGALAGSPESSPERRASLAAAIAEHANRIPPTIVYAQSQQNNHLVLEAAGLYSAGCLLPAHPRAAAWKKLGRRLLNRAFLDQIARDGTYIQHSANYHRLVLQAACWVQALANALNQPVFDPPARRRLGLAARWLVERTDSLSGRTPNLGHNDGALLLPLAGTKFEDYRPTAQAASRAFLGQDAFPPGPWDGLSAWLGLEPAPPAAPAPDARPGVLVGRDSWASLRAVRYTSRPGQADQLHLDLWFKGLPLALDAGTYRYNAPPPWENALASTAAHNTVMLDGREQMTRAGKFLWLDWAQAEFLERKKGFQLAAHHTGYRRLNLVHERQVTLLGPNNWQVLDKILPLSALADIHSARLHWLLPDCPWDLQGTTLRLDTPQGKIAIRLGLAEGTTARTALQLVRAGKLLSGRGEAPEFLGWFSPTYSVRLPALSLRFTVEGALPLAFTTDWLLP